MALKPNKPHSHPVQKGWREREPEKLTKQKPKEETRSKTQKKKTKQDIT